MSEQARAKDVPELAALPPEQRAEAWRARHAATWRRDHPVDIRLTLPLWPGRRYFVTIIAGREKRSAERVRRERVLHPLLRPGNLAFLLLGLVISGGLTYFIMRGIEVLGRL